MAAPLARVPLPTALLSLLQCWDTVRHPFEAPAQSRGEGAGRAAGSRQGRINPLLPAFLFPPFFSLQTQMEEFRQLKEALQKMPSFKEVGAAKGQQSLQALKEQPMVPGNSPLQLARQKVGCPAAGVGA